MRNSPFVLTLALLVIGATGPKPFTAAVATKIDRAVEASLKRQNIAGASVAIAERGHIVYAKAYGLRDLVNRVPVDTRTTFRIGSITKQFTASAIMLLVQDGKLRLDDRLSKYLPGAPHAAEVTIRNLLTHTSGIVGYTETEGFDAASKLPATPQHIVATIASQPLAFAPGTDWQYSNTNFILLGMVVSKVSREPYEEFVRQHVLEPLHLSTIKYWNNDFVYPDDSYGYTALPYEPFEPAAFWNWDWAGAAGGLAVDPSDLARWDEALDGGRVVTAASFAEMTTAQKLKNGKSTGYGFGLGIGSFDKRKVVAHSGGVPGFITENFTIPSDGVAIVLFANGDNYEPGPITRQIAAALYGVTPPAARFHAIDQRAGDKQRARRYLAAALTTGFEGIPMRADFARYVDREARRQYADLGRRLGPPTTLDLTGTDVRPPLTTYFYRVRFAHEMMLYSLALDRNGTVTGIGLQPWYR